jgi:hypothetical protein
VHRPPEALDAPAFLNEERADLPGRPLLRRLAFGAVAVALAGAIVLSFLFTGM